MNTKETMAAHHEVVTERLACVIVCSTGTEAEALAWVRAERPANWTALAPDAPHRAAQCLEGRGTHYMFEA